MDDQNETPERLGEEGDGGFAADDETLAETQAAFEAERDARDEELYEGVFGLDESEDIDVEDDKSTRPTLRMAWERDTSLIEAHRAMHHLFDEIFAQVDTTRAYREVGLDPDLLTVSMSLNMVTGPLVMAGLQLLGLYLPEYRPEIEAILRSMPVPEETEEDLAQIRAASEKLQDTLRDGMFSALEDALGSRDEDDDIEPNLGMGLN